MSNEQLFACLLAIVVAQAVFSMHFLWTLGEWLSQMKQGLEITNEKLDAIAEEVLKSE